MPYLQKHEHSHTLTHIYTYACPPPPPPHTRTFINSYAILHLPVCSCAVSAAATPAPHAVLSLAADSLHLDPGQWTHQPRWGTDLLYCHPCPSRWLSISINGCEPVSYSMTCGNIGWTGQTHAFDYISAASIMQSLSIINVEIKCRKNQEKSIQSRYYIKNQDIILKITFQVK